MNHLVLDSDLVVLVDLNDALNRQIWLRAALFSQRRVASWARSARRAELIKRVLYKTVTANWFYLHSNHNIYYINYIYIILYYIILYYIYNNQTQFSQEHVKVSIWQNQINLPILLYYLWPADETQPLLGLQSLSGILTTLFDIWWLETAVAKGQNWWVPSTRIETAR